MEEKIINDDVELYLASEEPVEADNEQPITEEEPTVEPMSAIKDAKKAVRVGEIPEFRERNKKRFKMSDGTEQEVFYASDVHVLDDEAGQYDDIEDTLTEDEDGKHLVCGRHSFIAKFSNDEKNDELFSIEQGKHKVTVFAKKNYKNKNKGRKPDVRKRDFDSENASKIISFSEIEQDSIYEYTVESAGVKENIIVKGTKKTYRYPFFIKCENVKAVLDAKKKRIAFTDIETDEEVFHIPTPFMVDSNTVVSTAVNYELVSKDNGDSVLTVIADSDWMNAEERAFPVIIDPQIKVTNASILATYSWNDSNYMYSGYEHTVGVVATALSSGSSHEEIDCSGVNNNSMKDALDLAYNKWTLGSIPNVNDFVWYKFVADVDEAHNGECIGNYTFYTSGSLDTVGFLYDASGNQIGYNDDSNGLNFGISANLTYGETYYLKVRAWSTKTGSYKVSCVATDKYCCGDLAPEPPTYSYSRHRMYLDFNYPSLSLGARIKKAELKVYRKNSSVSSANAQLGLYHINDEFYDCCYYEPSIEGSLIDYDSMNESGPNLCYTFDITSLIDRLNKGETYNNKFVLKLVDETLTSNNNIVIYGASSSAYKPELVITYEPNYAVNTSYQSHTHQIGKFGQAAIDLQYGNLTFDSTDFSWAGNRMPVTVKHLYNSILGSYKHTYNSGIKLYVANFNAMNVGYGFKLNVMQSMSMVNGEYIYTDENGAETVLKPIDECHYENKDEDMLYDSCNYLLTVGDEKRTFDTLGRLVRIEDGNHNTNRINYTAGRITSVVDGADRTFEFNYSGNNLVSIVAPDGTSVQYTYSGSYLSTITYPDGSQAVIGYSLNKPTSVILKDADGNSVYKVVYTFSGYKVTSVTEYGVRNGAFVQGSRSTYSYSMASKRTTVTTTELEDDCDGGNVIKTVYTFDDDGNVISDYVYSEDTGNTGVDGEVSGIHPYSADGGASIIRNSTNMLYNHTFQNGISNWEIANECCSCTNMYTTTLSDKFRRFAMVINATDSSATNNTVSQNTVSLAAGEYTFSAFVRVHRTFKGNNPGAYIRVSASDGTVLAVSERLEKYDSQYVRLIAPFEIDHTQSVKVEFVLDGDGLVYVCAPQLENNPFANNYNMLQNGNFELGASYWYYHTNCSVNTATRFNMSKSMRMIGDVNGLRYCRQLIYPIYDRSVRETFTLSGWAKGYGLPMHERNGDRVPTFRLRAVIHYTDGTNEPHTADFSPCTEEWQFTSLQFSKENFKHVSYIYIYCDYDYNCGTAFFDDIQLVRNSIETNLSANDFVVEAEEDTDYEDTDVTDSTESEGFAEVVDTFGNTITETTFTDGEFGTIYRAFKFNEDDNCCPGDDAGNNLIEETDARGHKTTYTVDSDTSRNEEVTDRLGNKTAYEYDNSGRTTKVTSKKADGTELAHVSYAYDTFDNMAEIVRGDGMKYALAYNEFHNLESIGIEGKSEKLIQYTYKNGNGRLKEMKYANGDTMKATYNSIGQMVAETWFDKNSVEIARYKYVYDGDGNIVRSIDISGKKEYNYEYEEGRIVRATEADIELNSDIVISKVIVNTVKYYYDSEGKMIRKVITPTGGSAQTIYYETNDDNTVVKFSAGGRTVTSHSGTDSFGRKVFDELQLGTGFVSRQFSYMPGAITDEHKKQHLIKSTATTQLVSQIILSNGTTLSYSYDAEERITSVVETYTVDETTVTNTTLYTYDALGQLETETKDGVTVKFEYDNYGNITAKGVVDENGEIAEATKISYVYGNDTWKDLLTSYNGQSITYDAQGNPTSYLGHTLTWEKGRQLKSFDGNTYTYNANGIRTSKTVNGVKHEYTLDGTKILRETWDSNTLIPLYDNEDSVCGILYNNIPYYFIKNLQGDVIAIVDKDAQTVARYTYDAWGAITNAVTYTELTNGVEIATVNPFRYRGYYFDQSIGLYYLQSRYYDPQVGRFVNGDEAVILNISNELLSCNLFCYCENNSVNESDYGGTLSVDGFLNHVKAFFVGIGRFFSSLTINLKNIYTPYKRSGKYIYINTLVISLVIDLIILLVSRAVSLGLKGILTGIKSLAKFFKNSVKNIIKDIILPFFRKTIKTYLKPLFTFILKKIGLSFLKNVVIYATDNSLPNAGTICSWLLSSVYSAGNFISFILDLYDGKLDNYYCIQAT